MKLSFRVHFGLLIRFGELDSWIYNCSRVVEEFFWSLLLNELTARSNWCHRHWLQMIFSDKTCAASEDNWRQIQAKPGLHAEMYNSWPLHTYTNTHSEDGVCCGWYVRLINTTVSIRNGRHKNENSSNRSHIHPAWGSTHSQLGLRLCF